MGAGRVIRDGLRAVTHRRSPVIVPLIEEQATRRALDVGCRLAADHRTSLLLVAPLFVALELPLDAHFHPEEAALRAELARAGAVVERRRVRCDGRVVRARHGQLGPALAEVAAEVEATLIVVGATIESRRGFRRGFSRDVWSVVQHAPCPVLVASAHDDAEAAA